MRLSDAFDELGIGRPAEAFVMHDHVVLSRPIGIGVDRNLVVAAVLGVLAFVYDVPDDVRPLAEPFGDDSLLVLVV